MMNTHSFKRLFLRIPFLIKFSIVTRKGASVMSKPKNMLASLLIAGSLFAATNKTSAQNDTIPGYGSIQVIGNGLGAGATVYMKADTVAEITPETVFEYTTNNGGSVDYEVPAFIDTHVGVSEVSFPKYSMNSYGDQMQIMFEEPVKGTARSVSMSGQVFATQAFSGNNLSLNFSQSPTALNLVTLTLDNGQQETYKFLKTPSGVQIASPDSYSQNKSSLSSTSVDAVYSVWATKEGFYNSDTVHITVLEGYNDWNVLNMTELPPPPPTIVNLEANAYKFFSTDAFENVLVGLTNLSTMELDTLRTDVDGFVSFDSLAQTTNYRLTFTHEDTKTWEIDFFTPTLPPEGDPVTLDTVVSMIPSELYSSLNEVMVQPSAWDIGEMTEGFNIQHNLYGSLNMYVEPTNTGWSSESERQYVIDKFNLIANNSGINITFSDQDFYYPINNSPGSGYDPYTTDPDIVGTKVSKGASTCISPPYVMSTGESVRVGSLIHTNGSEYEAEKEFGRMWGFREVVSRSSCMNPDPNAFNDIDNVIFTITNHLGKKRYFDLQHELNDVSDLRDAPYWSGKSSTENNKSIITPVTDFTQVNAQNYWKMN